MSEIFKIKDRVDKASLGSSQPSTGASDLPLDHQLTFDRNASEKWTFKDGYICLNGEDIEALLDMEHNDVKFQSAVSDAVSEYKDLVWRKGSGLYIKFAIRADSIQDKILCNMKRIYDERTGGVRLAWGDGSYLLNNINVRALLALYHVRPTEKARKFLSGLKAKLALILVNKNGSPQFERVHTVIQSLYAEVDHAISATPIDGHYLPDNSGRDSV